MTAALQRIYHNFHSIGLLLLQHSSNLNRINYAYVITSHTMNSFHFIPELYGDSFVDNTHYMFLFSNFRSLYLKFHVRRLQSFDALCSSNFAIVPKWTSSGPSAILKVLAVAQRWDRTVSPDKPAPPWTCIAMSITIRAIFGAATCSGFSRAF